MKDLIKRISKARFVFVCGNGGSAATAEHLTNDLFSKGISAICLNSNTSIMTMIANDFGYDVTFSKQLLIYADKEDMLITLSCSGTSKNVVNAILAAKILGMDVYKFKSFDSEEPRDFGKLEDEHLQLVHRIKNAL